MKKFLALTLVSGSALANLHLAPPDFDSAKGRAIFVDFKTAQYDLTYDFNEQTVIVKSTVKFVADKSGHPIFDLIPTPRKVTIDGVKSSATERKDPNGSKLRILDTRVSAGEHVMTMENEIRTNVNFREEQNRVSSAFWIRDLKYRKFMEQYIPANYEFDQYKMTMNISFVGEKNPRQEFYTNGALTQTSKMSWKIEFPEYFTSSSPYYHTTPVGSKRTIRLDYQSVSGKTIPMTIYTDWYLKTSDFRDEAVRVMAELEADYGAWGHPSFVAYGTLPGGGMEHSGATQTSFGALDHEMLHSYFAKGVMPADGNSGWIDEAIASWRDYGYQRLPTPGIGGSNIGGHSVYQRNTDDRSYVLGRAFMGHLDFLLQNVGGLKAFLRGYFAAYNHTVVTTEHFKNNLEFFSGMNFDHEFDTYIYGKGEVEERAVRENPMHKAHSDRDLLNLL